MNLHSLFLDKDSTRHEMIAYVHWYKGDRHINRDPGYWTGSNEIWRDPYYKPFCFFENEDFANKCWHWTSGLQATERACPKSKMSGLQQKNFIRPPSHLFLGFGHNLRKIGYYPIFSYVENMLTLCFEMLFPPLGGHSLKVYVIFLPVMVGV